MVFFARAIHYSDIRRFSVLHCIATRTIAEFKKNIEHDEMMSYNRCHFCALCFAFHFGFFFCPFGFVCSNLIALSIPQHPSVRSSRLREKKCTKQRIRWWYAKSFLTVHSCWSKQQHALLSNMICFYFFLVSSLFLFLPFPPQFSRPI